MKNKKQKNILLILLISIFIVSITILILNPIYNKNKINTILSKNDINLDYQTNSSRKIDIGEGVLADSYILDESTPGKKIIIKQKENNFLFIPRDNLETEINEVRVGDTLKSVLLKNGGDFELYGFEWTEAGLVTNWLGGNFDNKFSIKFEINTEYNDYVYSNLVGDHKLNANSIDLSQVNLVVEEMTLLLR